MRRFHYTKKNKKIYATIIAFFLGLSLFFNISFSEKEMQYVQEIASVFFQQAPDLHPVVRVVDGDTIRVQVDGSEKVVRIVNIDAPESVHPSRPVECMGVEASQKMQSLVGGKLVMLQPDESQQNRDRYGRLLRYVFLEDGTDVGLEMIRQGYAHSVAFGRTDHIYVEAYEQAQKYAQEKQLGLWGDACAMLD